MNSSKKKKILVLRYRFIGDTILTIPFLRNLRRAEPDAFIAWVVAPGSADVIDGNPYVDELIFWDPVTIHADSRGTHRTISSKIAFIKDLRSRKFNKVYVLKRSFSSAIIAALSGAKERVGFDTEGRGFLLTKRTPYRQDRHEVLNFLDVLRADGIPVLDDHLDVWISAEERRQAAELLTSEGIEPGVSLLAIHPFASNVFKRWPLENFAAVATQLQKAFGLTPVILGGSRDVEILAASRHLFPQTTIDLVGKCSVRVSMAVLHRSSCYIGNDSGIMHLAAQVGIPLLAVLGSTSPVRFGPWGKNSRIIWSGFPCAPCKQKSFAECKPSERMCPPCLEAIGVDRVVKESIEFFGLEEHRKSSG